MNFNEMGFCSSSRPTTFIPKGKYDILKDENGHLFVLYAYENGEQQTEVITKDIWIQAKAAMGY
jgi:hypothetical protein